MNRRIKTIKKKKVIKINSRYLELTLSPYEVEKIIDIIPKRKHDLSGLRKELIKWINNDK